MSIPTLQGLQTALSGLLANQEALDVTGNNIANAQTPGYTRQSAVMETAPPLVISALSPTTGEGARLGTGVGVQSIVRIRDTYLDAQYRAESSSLGEASTSAEILGQAQTALDEPSSSGLSAQLSSFWSAWNELANSPGSAAAREGVITAGKNLATTLNQLSAQIEGASGEARTRYEALTGPKGEVQSDAQQIAQLNGQIKLALGAGQQPNELLDRRDQLVDNLSKLAQVSVTEHEDGTVSLSFGNAAQPLVEGSTVHWPQALTSASGGQLGALLSLTSPAGKLAGYEASLNEIASALASSVNAHQPETPFFSGSTAASIAVSASGAQIQTGPAGEPGANDLAQTIANLRGGTADQRWSAFVIGVGSDVQSAKQTEAGAQAMVSAVEERRQAVSGVSTDEEMTQLVTFQRGYEASARVLTAMDQMLETLIEHTGVVGL
jgi:flagellar hook-associated protein 1 FlgK